MSETSKIPSHALVGDIGGTNARFAIADLATLALSHVGGSPTASHSTLAHAIRDYLKGVDQKIEHAGIAVAGPLLDDTVKLTNAAWTFCQSSLAKDAGLKTAHVFNDFEAQAYCVPVLAPEERHQLGGTEPVEHAPKVVLGPGTGLGVAGLVWSASGWVAVAGEGGHVTLAAENERELALIERMRKGLVRLSVERALSGPGLAELYQAIAASRGFGDSPLSPAEIEHLAISGEDEMAEEALDFFVSWLGRFAGDMALVFGARGGAYLGGGIAPKMLSRLQQDDFREAFERKGRMTPFVAPIPVYVVVADNPGLRGAAAGLRTRLKSAVT
jgi:glucokinase